MNRMPPIVSSQKAALLVGLMLAGVLAGCVDDGSKECVDVVCTATPRAGDAFLTNATRPTATYPDCTGAYLGADVPPAVLQGFLPSEFAPVGLVPGMANLMLLVVECPHATVGGVRIEGLRYAMTAVGARPVDESWSPPVAGHYAFEVFANNADVVAEWATWGLPAIEATIDVSTQSLPGIETDSWIVRAEDRSYAFPVTRVEGEAGGGPRQLALWTGDGPYQRIDRNETTYATTGGIGMETITMEGEAAFAQIMNVPALEAVTRPYRESHDEWRAYQGNFSR